MRFHALLLAGAAAICAACALPGSTSSSTPFVQHIGISGDFTYDANLGSTPRDLYFVFTNTDMASPAPKPTVGSIFVNGTAIATPRPQDLPSFDPAPGTKLARIAEFNRNPKAALQYYSSPGRPQRNIAARDAASDTLGLTDTFVTDYDKNGNPISVTATCALVNSMVDLGGGRLRSLSIWVDSSKYLVVVTPAMVAAFADQFLKNPASADDIYHWDTAAVGEPWGPHSVPQLIDWDAGNTITILLTDLNPAYPASSYTVGFFWAKDNFKASAMLGSNQRIMFYLDATLYSTLETGETAWAETNYWPKIEFSTIAHEFQHMIQFYQKQVLHNNLTGTDTWINEMCSQIMEDLVADKLKVEGPRGVAYDDPTAGSPGNTQGRIPSFNTYLSLALPGYEIDPQDYVVEDYSTSYAFGAWLARNFGGATLLRRIVTDQATGPDCVTNAVSAYTGKTETMAGLLDRWAVSVLASARTGMPPGYQFNSGAWVSSSEGGVQYNLGSIDFFNYSPAPKVSTTGGSLPSGQQFYSGSNVYFRAASQATGKVSFQISAPQGVAFSTYISP